MSHAFDHHDHAVCAQDLLERAERLCESEGTGKLTPLRRRALEAMARSHRPIGAYELIELLGEGGKRPAPTTVYRTLDFLISQGLVHRISSRNAFVACSNPHARGDVVVFLLCRRCGQVAESGASNLGAELGRLAAVAGFSPRAQVVELDGDCERCLTHHKD